MFCPNCGKEMSDGALFCPNCGFKKGGVTGSSTYTKNSVSFDIKKIIPIIAIILVIFVVYSFVANRHCKYDGCELKVYRDGYCQKHYANVNAQNNVNDVLSGNKSVKEAANDFYDKSFTNDQKKEIESGINDLKNALGGLFGN